MKKQLSFIWMSLLLVLAACSDGLDNIEYNSDSGITVAAPEVTETTGTSLTLTASATGNVGDIVRRGFCYSANAQTPTISDNVVDADENFLYVPLFTVTAVIHIPTLLKLLREP